MDRNEARADYEATMLARKNLAVNLSKSTIEAMGPEKVLTDSDPGGLMGLALDVKPTVYIANPGDREAVKHELERWGSNFQLIGNLVVNKRALLKSMAEQSDVAEEFGWDFGQSLEENLAKVNPKEKQPNQYRALTGLVLGFPEKAVRDFVRASELQGMGAPGAHDFFNYGLSAGCEEKLGAGQWAEEDIQKLQEFSEWNIKNMEANIQLPYKEQADAERKSSAAIRTENAELLRGWYKKYFNLSPEDADFLLSLHSVSVETPDGKPVYVYMESSPGESAATADLRMKVSKAFHEVGL